MPFSTSQGRGEEGRGEDRERERGIERGAREERRERINMPPGYGHLSALQRLAVSKGKA